MTARPDVLVVGAGPTGLATALYAHDHGAAVRIVERRPEAFRPSRALVLHARTLEVLRPLGVVGALLDRADTTPRALLRLGARTVAVTLAGFGWRDTAYPHLTLIRQMEVENVLADALRRRGVPIERGTELIGLADRGPGAGVAAVLRSPRGVERAGCRFLAGCDGAAGSVRRLAGVGWRGRPYREEIVLADLELTGELAPGVAGTGPLASFLRGTMVPPAAPALALVLRCPWPAGRVARLLSQLDCRYPSGPMAVDHRPPWPLAPGPGERLPDGAVPGDGPSSSLHALLAHPGVHVLLGRDASASAIRLRPRAGHLHRLHAPGSGVLAVRPDGYVGYRGETVDDRLLAWLATAGVAAGPPH